MSNQLGGKYSQYSHIPFFFMIKLAAYLNITIPIFAERKRLLFDKYKLEQTKSVKADNTTAGQQGQCNQKRSQFLFG
eukprot:jgi/Orpsp1_1/1175715/evm.model.c7180000054934.1